MKGSTILLIIAIGAFIFSRFARHRAKNILVSTDLTVDQDRIKQLQLFVGQELSLYRSDQQDVVNVYLKEDGKLTELLGSYTDAAIYNHLEKKDIKAYIYAINGYIVTVEIKFYDSL